MAELNWEKLLCKERFRQSENESPQLDGRNPFQNDYTRIILSPHFRRLQDKAQVFPYDDNDFVRTRLTHSLEVSNFAHSLGLSVENELIRLEKMSPDLKGKLPALLSVSGLCHDIGNPPFGHFGEECIKSFFKKLKENDSYFAKLNEQQQSDLLNFDGNVQGFRLLRKLGPSQDSFSYNLTYSTLISIVKYPFSSLAGNQGKEGTVSRKKFGYFSAEEEDYLKAAEKMNLINKRHPAVYLMEAADDIAYSVSDIEDGFKKGIINIEILRESIRGLNDDDLKRELINNIDTTMFKKELENRTNKNAIVIQRFRIKCQSKMIIDVVETFVKYHDEILNGDFDEELIKKSNSHELRKMFKELGNFNFEYPQVLKREIAGEQALNFHLSNFYEAIFNRSGEGLKTKNNKLYHLLSPHYRFINEKFEPALDENYKRFLLLTDFVSGMTDTYALKLYHELSGINPY